MTAPPVYLLHGLRVSSELRLDAPLGGDAAPDIEITLGAPRPIPATAPAGELLSQLTPPGAGSALTVDQDGYIWRAFGVCDFVVDRERRHVRLHLAPGAEPELASLLAVTFIARMLVLDGHCVLHASAVATDGSAIGIVGHSGSGKSTLAALCCAAGAQLVSDDALRVDVREGETVCYRGSCELRLRPQAAALGEQLAGTARATLDGRTAIRPQGADSEIYPLRALVVPRLSATAQRVSIERLHGANAVIELMRFPRTLGWTDLSHAQNLDALSRIVASVPVLEAEVPWSAGHLDSALGRELLSAVTALTR